ncbi:hypothetical protein GF324_10390 [bacterium]|nr:hypothetical protein [bacterium]
MWLLLGVIGVLVISSAVWDFYRVRSITDQLAEREARGLIHQVRQAAESATLAEEAVRGTITDHLFAVAYLTARTVQQHGTRSLNLDMTAFEGGVSRVGVLGANGRWSAGSVDTDRLPAPDLVAVNAKRTEQSFYYTDPVDSTRYYLAAVAVEHGGAVVVGIEADELLVLRSSIGLSALLDGLEDHPEVLYALVEDSVGILAGTRDLPVWIGGTEDRVWDRALAADILQTALVNTPDGPVYEAMAPFGDVALRLGLRTDELMEIRRRSIIALVLRTALILALAGLAIMVLLTLQNVRLLSEERERILADVRRLEADRTLRERLAAMGALAGGVAHEIRNPLNTVDMAAQRLGVEYEPQEDGEGYRRLLQSLREETRRIERIVEDFLTYARPPKANRSENDLKEALAQVEQTFRPAAESAGVELEFVYGNTPRFGFDADQVRQAALNLLRNALDAVPQPGGWIGLRTGLEEEGVWLRVEDNGPGVPTDEEAKIFDLYYTTRPEGTGVGLPMVHRIAVEHGGRIAVGRSERGGASFTLVLSRKG